MGERDEDGGKSRQQRIAAGQWVDVLIDMDESCLSHRKPVGDMRIALKRQRAAAAAAAAVSVAVTLPR